MLWEILLFCSPFHPLFSLYVTFLLSVIFIPLASHLRSVAALFCWSAVRKIPVDLLYERWFLPYSLLPFPILPPRVLLFAVDIIHTYTAGAEGRQKGSVLRGQVKTHTPYTNNTPLSGRVRELTSHDCPLIEWLQGLFLLPVLPLGNQYSHTETVHFYLIPYKTLHFFTFCSVIIRTAANPGLVSGGDVALEEVLSSLVI